MNRAEILEKASEIVTKDRECQYGSPEDNFGLVAKLWNSYTDKMRVDLTSKDVAVMLALLKVARIKTGIHSNDNFVDLAGYAACAGEISHRMYTPPPKVDVNLQVGTGHTATDLEKEMREIEANAEWQHQGSKSRYAPST